ncbi:hypothetical protein B0T20DRAFT_150777 [Sordaria brevicollis]|uniref:Uncharacterized protein n=1 Tax=Sordaria brevicollis TaxID=83679 RepID=A0AAE0UDY0_SORBR|nr:hypothetical protein B0T20DRAFT_150777 [Sordaria brevicollis]
MTSLFDKIGRPRPNTGSSKALSEPTPDEVVNELLKGTQSSPPYLPPYEPIGGIPNPGHDFAVCIIFLVLFAAIALGHFIIFQRNRRRGHKFIFSMLLFGFCMARITAISTRLAWAAKPDNPRLAIAANVLALLGGVIIITVNLFFTQRLFRAMKPQLGWHPHSNKIFWGIFASIFVFLAIVIITTVTYFFTSSAETREIERNLMLAGSGWLTTLSALPLVVLPYLFFTTNAAREPPAEQFADGSVFQKLLVLFLASLLTTLGAGFRLGAHIDARPLGHPAWYHHRGAFYFFNYTIDIIIVLSYAILRVDRMFWVPNGAKGPGDYTRDPENQENQGNQGNQGNQENQGNQGNPGAPGGGVGQQDAPIGSGSEDHEMDRLDRTGRKEAQDRVAAASRSTSTSTRVNEQSTVSSRALLEGSPSMAPESSTSQSGEQASSAASTRGIYARSSTSAGQRSTSVSRGQASSPASGIQSPGPSLSSSSRAMGKRVADPSAITGTATNSDNATHPADEEGRLRFAQGLQEREQRAVGDVIDNSAVQARPCKLHFDLLHVYLSLLSFSGLIVSQQICSCLLNLH